MAARWVFTPAAKEDLADAFGWYETRRTGLGDELFDSIEACLTSMVSMPTMHEVVYKHYRRALVHRFPYAIYYDCSSPEIVVHAIMHTARKPSRWRTRLQ